MEGRASESSQFGAIGGQNKEGAGPVIQTASQLPAHVRGQAAVAAEEPASRRDVSGADVGESSQHKEAGGEGLFLEGDQAESSRLQGTKTGLEQEKATANDNLEQRLLMYARKLQDSAVNDWDLSDYKEAGDLLSIRTPLNRSASRITIPVAVEVLAEVEKDATNVANNLVQHMANLRASLGDVTDCSLQHLECHNEAAGDLHTIVLDAASSGNRFINDCQRLEQETRGVKELAVQMYPPPSL